MHSKLRMHPHSHSVGLVAYFDFFFIFSTFYLSLPLSMSLFFGLFSFTISQMDRPIVVVFVVFFLYSIRIVRLIIVHGCTLDHILLCAYWIECRNKWTKIFSGRRTELEWMDMHYVTILMTKSNWTLNIYCI